MLRKFLNKLIKISEKLGFNILFSVFSSRQVLTPNIFNLYKLQKVRMRIASRRHFRRMETGSQILSSTQEPAVRQVFDTLCRDGVVLSRNFLPPDLLEETLSAVAEIKAGTLAAEHYVIRGAEYLNIDVVNFSLRLNDYLCRSNVLAQIPTYYLGECEPRWRLKLVRDVVGERDVNCDTHSDTFHNTLKAWVYLDAQGEEECGLRMWKRTHFNDDRVDHRILLGLVAGSGSPRVDDNFFEMGGYELFGPAIDANSVIFADTKGFHFRNPGLNAQEWRATLFCSFRKNPFFD